MAAINYPPLIDFVSLPASFYADPYPTYARLRSEAPVYRCADGSVLLTHYADCYHVYRNPTLFSSDKHKQFNPQFGDSLLFEHHTTSLVFNDPPLHTQVRRAIGNALSARTIAPMEAPLVELVDRLLDNAEDRGCLDGIADFAGAIPVEVIGNLLQVPVAERAPLRNWSLAILGALEVGLTQAQLSHGNTAVAEFLDYLESFVEHRRKHLKSTDDDMLARLLRWEADGFRLTGSTLYRQCIFILNAGHETTTNLIGNAILALLQHPAQLQTLRENPALIDTAVEEVLRYESPNQLGNRLATDSVQIGAEQIAADTVLTMCIGAANRDPQQFPEPDRFNVARKPNGHLAFGAGVHTCAGLTVARLEGRIAIQRIFSRFPRMHLDGTPERKHRARFRGLTNLPLRVQ
ncbi:MAG: cytochrome P450 [Gammaproteobacteria bacterium]|nr:cytochrome P450 [Gammaproteobacteria bacterium]